jgi:hypothetical protein
MGSFFTGAITIRTHYFSAIGVSVVLPLECIFFFAIAMRLLSLQAHTQVSKELDPICRGCGKCLEKDAVACPSCGTSSKRR